MAELRPYGITDESELPTVLGTTTPRRRGFLLAALAAEHARALLQAPTPPVALPSAAGLLGERSARELFNQAIHWGNVRSVFCPTHAVVPHAPERPDRCYLGCPIATTDDGPEAT